MMLIMTRLLRVKTLTNEAYLLPILNNRSLIKQNQQVYAKGCYKFSIENKNLINEKSQSLSINLMLKQLQIIDQYSLSYHLAHEQKMNSIRTKLIALIQQQIRFIDLNQVKITKYLKKLNYPSQSLKQELKTIIKYIQDFTSNIQAMSPYQLNSKCGILEYMHDYLLHKPKKQNILTRLSQIIESEIKFREALDYFKSYNCQQNIINTHPSKFPQTWKNIHILTYSNQKTMKEGYNTLSNLFYFVGGTIMMKQQHDKSKLGIHLYFRYLKESWRSLYNLLLFKNPSIENAKNLLNLFENEPLKKIVELSFDAIATNKFIYIPENGNFQDHIDIFKQTKDSIPVRVLYHKQLPLIKEGAQNLNQTDYIEDIFVHMHGGGFVVLSSHTTQNFTRKWANSLKIPVFSIDYRMAPDHVFPQAPNDCFQVYKFLTTQLYKYMKIKPANIFVGGDSAGANLSCAITTLALKNQLVIPKALYLAYPPVNMAYTYYPSRKYVLNDPLLWPTMVKMFLKCYFKNQEDMNSPLASPLLLTEQFVGGNQGDIRFPLKWPKTYIAVGMKDPLRDQSLLFMKKMTESNINCKCFIYEHMSHGFLSTDQIIKDTSKTIDHSIEILKELIAASKNQKK